MIMREWYFVLSFSNVYSDYKTLYEIVFVRKTTNIQQSCY